jgi:isoleucyl-tRNA synthetase
MQNARRESGLEVSDRIRVVWSCTEALIADALREHKDYISREILAKELTEGESATLATLNDVEMKYDLLKA